MQRPPSANRCCVMLMGRFRGTTQSALKRQLQRRKVEVRSQLVGDLNAVIAGTISDDALSMVRRLGIPVLGGEALARMLALDDAREVVWRGVLEPERATETHAVLSMLRQEVHGVPSVERWSAICAALDQCDASALDVAAQYVRHGTERWPLVAGRHPCEVPDGLTIAPSSDHYLPSIIGSAPPRWLQALRQGWRSEKFRLLRAIVEPVFKTQTQESFNRLFRHPDLAGLEAMWWDNIPAGDSALTQVFEDNSLRNLRILAICKNSVWEERTFTALERGALPALKALCLGPAYIRPLVATQLIKLGARLDHLALRGARHTSRLLDALDAVIKQVPALALSSLLTDVGEVVDVLPRLNPRLRWLDLSNNANAIGRRGLDLLWRHALPELTHVRLQRCDIGSRAAWAIARAPSQWQLTSLALPSNRLNNRAVEGLMSAPSLKTLSHLDLSDNRFDDGAVAWLCSDRAPKALEHLDLSWNSLGDAFALALRECPEMSQRLRVLCLNATMMGDEGIQALALNPALKTLHHLEVARNLANDGALRQLREALPHTRLILKS